MGPEPEGSGPAPARLGLFGGTFDPPHNGHVAVAKDVADALELDRVLWIPAGQPPHKTGREITPASIRYEMVRAAVAADRRFAVSALEIEREGPSYTVDTLRALHGGSTDTTLYFILGADEFRALGSWRTPERVLELAHLAVMDRDGERAEYDVPDVPGADEASFVPVGRIDISSTDVRDLVAAGRDVVDLVPAGVAAVIERERLYGG